MLQGLKHDKAAAQFIVDMSHRHSGELHILALGPLTNIALACQLDNRLHEHLVRALANSLANCCKLGNCCVLG